MARITLILSVITALIALLGGFRLLANELRGILERKRITGKWLIAIALCVLPSVGHAQNWSGVLATERAIDWSNAGTAIPTNRTQCGSTITAYTGTAATINSAIASCASGGGGYVLLGAGTFTLSTGITFGGDSGVTLRGNGPDSTFIVSSNSDSCHGQDSVICLGGNDIRYYGPEAGNAGGPVTTTWTAGYTQGATTITIAGVSSGTTQLKVGMFIVLDQTDDATDPGTDWFNTNSSTYTSEGGTDYGRSGRVQRQWVKVASCDGNSTPGHSCSSGTNITIDRPLYAPNWVSGKSPGAYWGADTSMASGNGVEDLSVECTGGCGSAVALIGILFEHDSWVKNVRGIYAPNPRAYVLIYDSARVTVRDSYFFGSQSESAGPTHYGIEAINTCDNLVENNIVQRRTSPYISNGDCGSVWAYNYAINDQYSTADFMQASNYSHEAGNHMVLHEGNDAVGIKTDIVHGTSNAFTFFRNYSRGFEAGKTTATSAAVLHVFSRYMNFVGNVLGTSGEHSTYASASTTDRIYALEIDGGAGCSPNCDSDSVTTTSLLRWGNWDVVTSTSDNTDGDQTGTRWCGNSSSTGWVARCGSASEIPTGVVKYPNTVPASETIPSSFYLSAKPSFYGSNAWPSIGPDISGGTISNVGGHVKRIPARICFEDVMGGSFSDTTPRTFNADSCYVTNSWSPEIVLFLEWATLTVSIGWHFRTVILATFSVTAVVAMRIRNALTHRAYDSAVFVAEKYLESRNRGK